MLLMHNGYSTPEFSDCGNLVGADRLSGKPKVRPYGTVYTIRLAERAKFRHTTPIFFRHPPPHIGPGGGLFLF